MVIYAFMLRTLSTLAATTRRDRENIKIIVHQMVHAFIILKTNKNVDAKH